MKVEQLFESGVKLVNVKHDTLVKYQVKLTPTEHKQVMDRKAVWHFGNANKPTPAIKKSILPNKKTVYWCETHRAYNVTSTLRGAIRRFHDFIKGTA